MSLGFSISDIVSVANLAWNVCQACRDCPAVFREIANEASATHAVLQRLENELQDKQSMLNRCDAAKRHELIRLIDGLRKVLEDLDKIIIRFKQGRRISNAGRMLRTDLNGLRSKLNHHFIAINAFTSSLARDSLARIETVLLKTVQEVQEGRRADPLRSASARKQLGIDLAKNGVPTREIVRYGPAITTFLLGCMSGKASRSLSLLDIASRCQKAIRDKREISDKEESTSDSDSDSSSCGESFKSFSEKSSKDGDSFSDGSYSSEETSSDEVSSSDSDSSRGGDPSITEKLLKMAIKETFRFALKKALHS